MKIRGKSTSKAICLGFIAAFCLISSSAMAGVTHPCRDNQFETEVYEPLRLQSLDGRRTAVVTIQQTTNISCVNLPSGAQHFKAKFNLIDVDQNIPTPVFVASGLRTLDAHGEEIDVTGGVAQIENTIRLLPEAVAVEVILDGFESVIVEL